MTKHTDSITQYQWTGINLSGHLVRGDIEARTMAIAKARLYKQGIITKTISKKYPVLFGSYHTKIKPADITRLTRQLVTLTSSGISLFQALEITAKGQCHWRLKQLIEIIKQDVQTGLTFAESLRKHPRWFNELFCNLVEVGEQSGTLNIMLEHVARHKENMEAIKKKVNQALGYPLAVCLIACLVTTGLLIFVVPQFEVLFKNFDAELPLLTQVIIDLSDCFQSYWFIMLGLLAGIVYGLHYAKNHSPQFSYTIDKLILRLPFLGIIIEKVVLARFTRTLAIICTAGIPLVDALKSSTKSTGNIVYTHAIENIIEGVSTGQSLLSSLENTQLFPHMLVQMVGIGEASGALERMLNHVADCYEDDVSHAIDALSHLLEPMMITILGLLVGGLVIAMYLPIFKLGSII